MKEKKKAKSASAPAASAASSSGNGAGGARNSASAAPPFSSVSPELSGVTLAAVRSMGFSGMTPVQAASIPLFLRNKDVFVEACTGSGKTLAFLIPVFEMLFRREDPLRAGDVGAIIISPTRELARQIHEIACAIHAHCSSSADAGRRGKRQRGLARPFLAVGGDRLDDAASKHVLIGTPGRLEEVLRRQGSDGAPALNTRSLEVLVLDEADRLLDLGFQGVITSIIGLLPKQRRTGLFSATQTREVRDLARVGLRNPVTVAVRLTSKAARQQATPQTLRNFYCVCSSEEKMAVLLRFLRGRVCAAARASGSAQKLILFFTTCASVDFFAALLERFLCGGGGDTGTGGVPVDVVPLHGKMPQKKRLRMYARFLDGPKAAQENAEGTKKNKKKRNNNKKKKSGKDDAGSGGASSNIGGDGGGKVHQSPRVQILCCTDVAARGIDIPDISWIVQFDPPTKPDFFVHRVGRTARAGRSGSALVLLRPNEVAYVDFLRLRKVPMAEIAVSAVGGDGGGDDDGGDGDERSELEGGKKAAMPERKGGEKKGEQPPLSLVPIADSDAAGNVFPRSAAAAAVAASARRWIFADRDLLEKGTKAFVSFVRAYIEHECQYIFQFTGLNVASLARSFILLRVPKLSELRRAKTGGSDSAGASAAAVGGRGAQQSFAVAGFAEEPKAKVQAIAFRDKAREKERQRLLAALQEERAKESEESRARAMARKDRERQKKEEKQRKKKRKRTHKSYTAGLREEWDALAAEEQLAKKLRKGKISQEDFDREMAILEGGAREEVEEGGFAGAGAVGDGSRDDEGDDDDDEEEEDVYDDDEGGGDKSKKSRRKKKRTNDNLSQDKRTALKRKERRRKKYKSSLSSRRMH